VLQSKFLVDGVNRATKGTQTGWNKPLAFSTFKEDVASQSAHSSKFIIASNQYFRKRERE
jgi:hypothetical protein